jgi:hypothetical protein
MEVSMLHRAILAFVLSLPTAGVAAPSGGGSPVGAEAEAALVCAWLFTATAARLEADGVIGPAKREVAVSWSERVMSRYVGGSADAQQAALAAIGAGRATDRLVEEFAAQGNGCLERFPI